MISAKIRFWLVKPQCTAATSPEEYFSNAESARSTPLIAFMVTPMRRSLGWSLPILNGALSLGLLADGSYGEGWNGVTGPVRGLLFGDVSQLLAQLIGVAGNAILVFVLAYGFFRFIDRVMGNRVPSEVEWTGLDSLEMGSQAYPHA